MKVNPLTSQFSSTFPIFSGQSTIAASLHFIYQALNKHFQPYNTLGSEVVSNWEKAPRLPVPEKHPCSSLTSSVTLGYSACYTILHLIVRIQIITNNILSGLSQTNNLFPRLGLTIKISGNTNNILFLIKFYYIGLLGRFSPIFYFNCKHFLFVYVLKQKQKQNSPIL